QLKERVVSRVYFAIVKNRVRDLTGAIIAPIGRHPVDRKKMSVDSRRGRSSKTFFKVLKRVEQHTYLELKLETGRTHQIRVHLTSIGHPIVGDKVYGRGNKTPFIERQALHAGRLGFVHPKTGEKMSFSCPVPEDFGHCLKMLHLDGSMDSF
ncbi:MAG: RluA family pseudouridine synthase, partial [Nitrospinota bacterium]